MSASAPESSQDHSYAERDEWHDAVKELGKAVKQYFQYPGHQDFPIPTLPSPFLWECREEAEGAWVTNKNNKYTVLLYTNDTELYRTKYRHVNASHPDKALEEVANNPSLKAVHVKYERPDPKLDEEHLDEKFLRKKKGFKITLAIVSVEEMFSYSNPRYVTEFLNLKAPEVFNLLEGSI